MAGGIILKIEFEGDVRRFKMPESASYEDLDKWVAEAWPGLSAQLATYTDDEGDVCSLSPATFPDLWSLALDAKANGGKLMKLKLQPRSAARPAALESTCIATLKEKKIDEAPAPLLPPAGGSVTATVVAPSGTDTTIITPSLGTTNSAEQGGEDVQGEKKQEDTFAPSPSPAAGAATIAQGTTTEDPTTTATSDGDCRGEVGGCHGGGCGGPKKLLFALNALRASGDLTAEMVASLAAQWLPMLIQCATRKMEKLNHLTRGQPLWFRLLVECLLAGTENAAPELKRFEAQLAGLLDEGKGKAKEKKEETGEHEEETKGTEAKEKEEKTEEKFPAPEAGETILGLLKALRAQPFDAQIEFLRGAAAQLMSSFEVILGGGGDTEFATARWLPPWLRQVAEHPGVSCDGCLQTPVRGPRFKCRTCDNFDLCGNCYVRKTELGHGDCEFACLMHPGMPMPGGTGGWCGKGVHHHGKAKGKGKGKGKGKWCFFGGPGLEQEGEEDESSDFVRLPVGSEEESSAAEEGAYASAWGAGAKPCSEGGKGCWAGSYAGGKPCWGKDWCPWGTPFMGTPAMHGFFCAPGSEAAASKGGCWGPNTSTVPPAPGCASGNWRQHQRHWAQMAKAMHQHFAEQMRSNQQHQCQQWAQMAEAMHQHFAQQVMSNPHWQAAAAAWVTGQPAVAAAAAAAAFAHEQQQQEQEQEQDGQPKEGNQEQRQPQQQPQQTKQDEDLKEEGRTESQPPQEQQEQQEQQKQEEDPKELSTEQQNSQQNQNEDPTQASQAAETQPDETDGEMERKVALLREMGFENEELNRELLLQHDGNCRQVLAVLLSPGGRPSPSPSMHEDRAPPPAPACFWVCPECTLENSLDTDACELCEAPRPGPEVEKNEAEVFLKR